MDIPVTCAIILKGEMVLATQRSESMHLPLHWEFPGGKLELGESPEDCLHREINEELGINITIIRPLSPVVYDYVKLSILLIPFIAEYSTGEINLTEHKSYGWFTKNELKGLLWAPADISILEEFLSL
jgi:8-oxo-dGTP diphosphatase